MHLVVNYTQQFVVSAHIPDKGLLLKPLFKEIFQFCSPIVLLKILVKKPCKHLFKVRCFVKTVFLFTIIAFMKIFSSLIKLKHLLRPLKLTNQAVYMNTCIFYLEENRYISLIGMILLKWSPLALKYTLPPSNFFCQTNKDTWLQRDSSPQQLSS